MALAKEDAVDDAPHADLEMDKYVNKPLRRQLVRTCLVVMRQYSYCCIAS